MTSNASSRHLQHGFELSDELRRLHQIVLERRYGGNHQANRAARVIQRAFRQYRLQQHWRRVRLHPPLVPQLRYQPVMLLNTSSSSTVHRRVANVSPPAPAPSSSSFSLPLDPMTMTMTTMTMNQSPRFSLHQQRHHRLIESTHIWVPRVNLIASSQNHHSNSLPRLDKPKHLANGHARSSRAIEKTTELTRNWSERRRRRHYRIALNFFNKKPERGIQFLIKLGFVEDSPVAIARMLIGRRGLCKASVGEFISTLHSKVHSDIFDCFVNEIDLNEMDLDLALRHFLTFFRLPGETQKIDRCMSVFARRYSECNRSRVALFAGGTDTAYILAFAIIMLNTDLHSRSIKDSKRMKLEDFIKNLRSIDAGGDLPRDMLVGIYERIRANEFIAGTDHVTQVLKVEQSIVGKDKPRIAESHRRLVCYCRLHQVLDMHKKQPVAAHQRELFLFNDMLIPTTYELREWYSLLGVRIEPFQTGLYQFGLALSCSDGRRLSLNATNEDDRYRFLADVRESIAETQEMEKIRIECEMDKHRLSRSDSQRDSGLPDMENNTVNCPGQSTTQRLIPGLVRRLSLNSLDSGMVEETCEFSS